MREATGDKFEQTHRRAIRPMEIVKNEQDRFASGRPMQEGTNRVEESEALQLRAARRRLVDCPKSPDAELFQNLDYGGPALRAAGWKLRAYVFPFNIAPQ